MNLPAANRTLTLNNRTLSSEKLISSARERSSEIRAKAAKEREAALEKERQQIEVKRRKWANEAITRLQHMHKTLFSDLKVDDWQWDGDDYLYYQLPRGRIYYYYSPDINSEAGFWSAKLYYFKERVGYGGTRFDSWDQLAILLDKYE